MQIQRHPTGRPGWFTIVCMSLLLAVLLGPTGVVIPRTYAQAQTGAYFSLSPDPATITGCGETRIEVWVNAVNNAYGAEFKLGFDPTRLEVLDDDPGTSGVNITPVATYLKPGFVIRNVADNTAGTVWYVMTQANPEPAKSFSGPIASLRVRAKAGGSTAINFTFTDLAGLGGVDIPASAVNGSVTANPPAAPSLSIAKLGTTDVRLSWTAVTGAASYSLYRHTTPYFTPDASNLLANPTTTTYDDLGILGDWNVQHYYTLRATCPTGFQSGNTNRVGEYDWRLYGITSSTYNDVSWVFSNPTITRASHLAAAIGPSVKSISQYLPGIQSYQTYSVGSSFNNFSLTVGQFLFIVTDTSAPTYFTMVGTLPEAGSVHFNLVSAATAQRNNLSLPLDQSSITSASTAAASVGSGVASVIKYDAASQLYRQYFPGSSFNNFGLVIGEPFILRLSTGAPPVWP